MLYVGPERLRITVQEGLGAYDLVEVPLTTAFEDWRAIARETAAKIKADGYRLVGVSAGPTAKVLINHMATQFSDVTFIDFGSVWDMYAGTPTRSGPKRLTDVQVDGLAWKNFHWTRPGIRAMLPPSVHDLLAIPGLVKEAEAEFLYKMATTAPVGMMVELGTFRGRTAAVLARTGAQVLSIDNYSYPHHPEVGEPAQRLAKFGLTADFRCADSRKVPAEVKDVALLYVDSEHVEAQINAELDAWLPLLVKGGIVVFHDYGKRTQTDVTRVVDKRMAKYKRLGQERSMIAFQC
jgi:predicted O-methyltransferase YrrM